MIINFVIILLLLWFIKVWLKRRKFYEKTSKLPKMDGHLPVIGIAHKFIGNDEVPVNYLQQVSRELLREGKPKGGWLGPFYYFFVVHTEDIAYIQRTCLCKDDIDKYAVKLLGKSSLFAPYNIWKHRRKVMVGAVSAKLINHFIGIFSKHSKALVQKLEPHVGKQITTWSLCNTYSFDSICESALDIQCDAKVTAKLLQGMNRVIHLVMQRAYLIWLQPDWMFRFFPEGREYDKIVNMLHQFTDDAIEKVQNELKKLTPEQRKARELEDRPKTLVESLIELSGGESGYTKVELREEVLALLLAASDTTAIAAANTLTLLMKYPEVQDKAYEELQEIFEGSSRRIEREDLVKMRYLERVIKETLRLFSPVPFIIRTATEDVLIPSGYTIPEGSPIVQLMWGALRDPQLWGTDADHFRPDRFLEDKNFSEFYAPFGFGRRNCIGSLYAMNSMKTVVASILRKYRVVGEREEGPIPHIKCKLNMTVKAADDYRLQFEYR